MARKRPVGEGGAPLQGAELSAMSLMARIADRAGHRSVQTVPAPAARPEPPAVRVSEEKLNAARVVLSEQNLVDGSRFRVAKRFIMRGSRMFTHRLVAAGRDTADAIELVEITHGHAIAEAAARLDARAAAAEAESRRRDIDTQSLVAQIGRLETEFNRLSNNLHAQLTSIELGVDDAASTVVRTTGALQDGARGLDARLLSLEKTSKHDRSELHRTRALLSRLTRTALTVGPDGAIQGLSGSAEPATDPMTVPTLDDSTYVDFEQRFRGTRDEIRSRQQDAVPFVTDLAGATAPLLDLGCGRGEWLDLLRELDIPAYGIDSNTEMVNEAKRAGLDAQLGDALAHLEHLDESSLQGVSAFHFVEHVPLDVLVRLLDSALIALRPGGTLLLETPNPTNLIVGAASFYMDPTHLRVLHPDFLSFLVESRGFVDVKVHYVHPVVEESVLQDGQLGVSDSDPRISRVVRNVEWALFGPQDYLVTARRAEVAL